MFELDRTFSQRSDRTGMMEWFFNAREGIFGPYHSNDAAATALKKFIDYHKNTDNDGGRSLNAKKKLSVIPNEFVLQAKLFDPTKKKKGTESF